MQLIIIILLIIGGLFYGKIALNAKLNSYQQQQKTESKTANFSTNHNNTVSQAQNLRKQQTETLKRHNKNLQNQRLKFYNQNKYFDNQ